MSIFNKFKKKKGCSIRYTATEILSAYSDFEQLEKIANQVIENLYLCPYFVQQVSWFVKNNSGKEMDVEDLVQESLFILKKNLLKQSYKGDDITSYTIGIARFSWLNIISKKSKSPMAEVAQNEKTEFLWSNIKDSTPNQEEWSIIQDDERNKSEHLLNILNNCISEKQIKLLSLKYIYKLSYKKISEQLAYKSPDAAKSGAMDARNKLKKCIQLNPRYKDLLSSFNI